MHFNQLNKPGSLLKVKTKEDKLPAQEIAALALQHMADDSTLLGRFMGLTGLGADDLREASSQPEFLVAVLDFYLGHEPNLLEFAKTRNIDPESVAKARSILCSDEAQYD